MIQVYQSITERGKGDCMRAALCSLLGLSDENVPNFMEEEDFWTSVRGWLRSVGYEHTGFLHNPNRVYLDNPTACCHGNLSLDPVMSIDRIREHEGVDGFFLACVISPKYGRCDNGFKDHHAVIVDHDLNIVHDPNKDYETILRYPLTDLIHYNGILYVDLIHKI